MNLITDRTLQDVERWRTLREKGWSRMTDAERREWLGETTPTPTAAKGMYTHNDLNRVESAVKTISERLVELGYKYSPLVVKTDWSYKDALWREDFERYLGNVATLMVVARVYPTTPDLPKLSRNLDYSAANDIEKILVDLDDKVTRLKSAQHYAGEIFSGEV